MPLPILHDKTVLAPSAVVLELHLRGQANQGNSKTHITRLVYNAQFHSLSNSNPGIMMTVVSAGTRPIAPNKLAHVSVFCPTHCLCSCILDFEADSNLSAAARPRLARERGP